MSRKDKIDARFDALERELQNLTWVVDNQRRGTNAEEQRRIRRVVNEAKASVYGEGEPLRGLNGPRVIDMSDAWKDMVKTNSTRWPLLALALKEPVSAAISTKSEWCYPVVRTNTQIAQGRYGGQHYPVSLPHWQADRDSSIVAEVNYNNQQIFRQPWSVGFTPTYEAEYNTEARRAKARKEQLEKLLDSMELTLLYGKRNLYRDRDRPVQTMGSIESLIGRLPTANDTVWLSVLRDMQLITVEWDRYGQPLDTPTYEYIIEFTVCAVRGEGPYGRP